MILKSIGFFFLGYLLNIVDYIFWLFRQAILGNSANPLDLQRYHGPKEMQSILVEDESDIKIDPATESGPWRNAVFKAGKELACFPYDGICTVGDLFLYLCKKFATKPIFGSRKIINLVEEKVETYENNVKKTTTWKIPEFAPMVWQTYSQVEKRVFNISKGLVAFTGLTEPGDKLGIYHETCQEWMMIAQACFQRNMTVVTVYSTLGKEAVAHALGQSEVKAIFVNEEDLLFTGENEKPRALHVLQKCSNITHVIYKRKFPHEPEKIQKQLIEPLNTERKASGMKEAVFITYEDLESLGERLSEMNAKYPLKRKATQDDLAYLMYTSGTSGVPKGVMITHKNIISAITGLGENLDFHPRNDEYILLGYLPLAHILEMVAQMWFMMKGGCIGYGSSRTLFDKGAKPFGDLTAIKPTLFTGVPRVYDTFKKTIITTVNDPTKTTELKKWMFNTAFASKKKALLNGRDTPLWNALVFSKFQQTFGGRIQILLTGGAPCTPNTQDFLRVCVGCSIVQGYGLTETAAAGGLQTATQKYSTGNNGPVVACIEVKLVSVPEMNYLVTDKPCPRGEICMRGNSVCKGYYKDDKLNAESFKNGWFYTGDIAQINPNGTISVIDRKKNIVKLQHGEYVAIEKLEAVYCNSRFLAPSSCLVYGDPYHNYLVALVLPDKTYLKQWCLENGIIQDEKEFNLPAICKNEKVRHAVHKDLIKQAETFALCRIEYLKAVALIPDEWTVNNYLTASMKLKRNVIQNDYKEVLQNLYLEE